VIIEVLVSERQPINALPHQLFNRMLDQLRIAMIGEAGANCLMIFRFASTSLSKSTPPSDVIVPPLNSATTCLDPLA